MLHLQHFLVVVTTDVQAAMVTVECTSVILRCIFLSGSQSRGCCFKFTTNGSMMTQNIERVDNSNSAQMEVIISTSEIDDFLVFDWESDGTISNVSVPVETESNCLDVSSTTGDLLLGVNLTLKLPVDNMQTLLTHTITYTPMPFKILYTSRFH